MKKRGGGNIGENMKVIVSDNTDHSKYTIVAYIYKILLQLPKEVKLLKVWSDGPSSQFKNRFIGAIILLFESLFPIKIIWNLARKGCRRWDRGCG